MAITQWIPIDDLYSKCESDIIFPSSYKNRVKEWIGECTETMKISKVLAIYHEKVNIKNYQIRLPEGTQTVLAIYKDNQRLHFSNSTIGAKQYRDINLTPRELTVWRTTFPTPELIKESDKTLPLPFYTQALQLLESYVISYEGYSEDYYTQNGNYLQFTKECGEIDLFYHGVLRDKEGKLLVPDNIFYTEAIVNWVEYKLKKIGIITGDPIASFNQFAMFRTQARNDISYPSPEKIQGIVDKMGLVSYDFYDSNEL